MFKRSEAVSWGTQLALAVVLGAAGCKGDAGYNTLIHVADEPVGLNCQYGGARITSGLDDNRDGILQESEVQGTPYYICSQRVDGDSSLILVSHENPGTNCAQGGIRVQVGLDDNDDRTLQPSEVDATSYVCDGLSRLLNITALAQGSTACETGGIHIESGWDNNTNGLLDPAEVDAQYNVCNGRASLTKVTPVSPGGGCADGGIKVQTGFDLNGNSLLDNNEIGTTQFVCDGADGFSTLVNFINEPANPSGPCVFGGTRLQSGLDINNDHALQSAEVLNSIPVCAVQVNANLTLVRNSVIVPGATCQYGGVKTEVGIDDNDDHVLQASEVDSTTNNCNSVIVIDGLNSLIETQPASSGQCLYGGFVFKSGLDDNRNNVLEALEVDQTRVVCNGAPGFNTLVSQSYLPIPSTDCGNDGGVQVKSGLDLNRNGTLDAAEVQNTSSVCNGFEGLPGVNSLIRMTDAGTACGIFGGVKIQTGLDDNFNNILDASEVDSTGYACNGQDGVPSMIVPVDAGAACGIYGGTKLLFGWDDNFNGVLDSSEQVPAYTRFVCNGQDGFTTLVETTEGDWLQCPAFGIRVDVGLDLDGDGFLDSGEITNTSYVCDGVSGP